MEKGKLEIWLTTYEKKVGIHSVKLSVINSSRNRFVADFNTVGEALNYANNNHIEVKEIKKI